MQYVNYIMRKDFCCCCYNIGNHFTTFDQYTECYVCVLFLKLKPFWVYKFIVDTS